jgi:hypothetical protein
MFFYITYEYISLTLSSFIIKANFISIYFYLEKILKKSNMKFISKYFFPEFS